MGLGVEKGVPEAADGRGDEERFWGAELEDAFEDVDLGHVHLMTPLARFLLWLLDWNLLCVLMVTRSSNYPIA
jgi:hypothetical protein